jgi:hypothetical protein
MPTYKLVTEDGTWLTDERLNGFDWEELRGAARGRL